MRVLVDFLFCHRWISCNVKCILYCIAHMHVLYFVLYSCMLTIVHSFLYHILHVICAYVGALCYVHVVCMRVVCILDNVICVWCICLQPWYGQDGVCHAQQPPIFIGWQHVTSAHVTSVILIALLPSRVLLHRY
jgi:hypothetical protein